MKPSPSPPAPGPPAPSPPTSGDGPGDRPLVDAPSPGELPGPPRVAAIDQGTTSTRCTVYDRRLRPVAFARREHRQIQPRSGWVEHDAAEILAATRTVVEEALERAGAAPGADGRGRLAAVGLTNQRETVVLWDRATGEPVTPAIVWQDTRTDRLCRDLARDLGAGRCQEITGLPPATYFSGPKIRWLLDRDPDLARRAETGELVAGTMDAWLGWHLGGGPGGGGPGGGGPGGGGPGGGRAVTDVTNASRTLLMDLERLEWSDEMLDAVGVPRALLPEIVDSMGDGFGTTAASSGFGAGVPMAGVLGDQQAALFGHGCLEPGESKCTYGTGCFLLAHAGDRPVHSRSGLLATVAWRRRGEPAAYALEGSVAAAGSLVRWLRDNLGFFDTSAECEALAREVEDTGGVYLVPAFSGLFAPRWRSDARGVIVGLTGYADRRHLVRAGLEAVAFQVREVLEAMAEDLPGDLPGDRPGNGPGGPGRGAALRVDGGMTDNDLLMQLQADVLGLPVERPAVREITSLGAAWAALQGAGEADDGDRPPVLRGDGARRWTPALEPERREARWGGWNRAVERSLGWVEPGGEGGGERGGEREGDRREGGGDAGSG